MKGPTEDRIQAEGVAYVLRKFKSENFSSERVQKILENEEKTIEHGQKNGFSVRLSRQVAEACKQFLASPKLDFDTQS